MQRAKKIGYVVALVFAASAMSGISAAAPPQPEDTPQPQETPPPSQDMPQKDMPSKDMPSKDEAQPKDQAPTKPSAPAETMSEKMSATVTVVKVNAAKRDLTVKDDQGNQFTVNVPEDVTRLDALKKGDKISIDYYESMTFALKKPGEPSSSTTTGTMHAPGTLPGGAKARLITNTAEVVNVDKSANKVTIKLPSGETDTIAVKDPAVQADLDKLKKGDKIKATYTQAVAISVTPQAKQPT